MSPERDAAIRVVADRLLDLSAGRTIRVAVDGRTAAGKTTLAGELAAAIGARAIRASLDGFHRPRAERWARGRGSAVGYYEDARDYGAVRRLLLDPLGPGGDGLYQTGCFDLENDRPAEGAPLGAAPGSVLIVDGTFLQRPEFDGAWEAVVFVAAPAEVTIARGITRDRAELGDAAEALHRERYEGAWTLYKAACDPERRAWVLFDNTDPAQPRAVFR
ncbi:MAG TPA: hypothetical protein VD929_08175 [Caulobacteraceae bacterium]|nr:hypothetical protein [Caulobacteraceae bacterium]